MLEEDSKLSHLDSTGAATMVDVSAKVVSVRKATAEAFVHMAAETLQTLLRGNAPKGEVLGVARVAGIQAAKRTPELIPLCHPLALEQVTVDFEPRPPHRLRIVASTVITAKTGIEMESLMAVSVAALTVYDMLKAVDRSLEITGIRLISKTGGKFDYQAPPR